MTTGFWQHDPLQSLAGRADKAELKVVVREHGGLGGKPGLARRVYFLDTPDLALYRHGVIVRFRDRRHDRDDAVVKLRPVAAGSMPRWLRATGGFHLEIDALPGQAVCSGALKKRLGRREVARTIAAGRRLTSLLSVRQRKLLHRYAPPGVRLSDLVVFGPIDVRCHSFRLRGLKRRLTAERWRYPDGTGLLELSTRCSVSEAAAVATRVATALHAYGVVPVGRQRTKTEMALLP